MWVPRMSPGMRSGVHWTRPEVRPRTREMTRTRYVLPRPGTPSRSTCPWEKIAARQSVTSRSWPTMARAISALRRRKGSAKPAIRSSSGHGVPAKVDGPSLFKVAPDGLEVAAHLLPAGERERLFVKGLFFGLQRFERDRAGVARGGLRPVRSLDVAQLRRAVLAHRRLDGVG